MFKRILCSTLLLVGLTNAQSWESDYWWIHTFGSSIYSGQEKNLWAIDFNGIDEYASNSSPVNLDLNDTLRIADSGKDSDFEDGDTTNWTGNGNHTIDTSSTNNGGSYGGVIVSDTTESIAALNDRDFSSGNIGNWVVLTGGGSNGTVTYDGTNPGAEKVGKITVGSVVGTRLAARLLDAYLLEMIPGETYTITAQLYLETGESFTAVQIMYDDGTSITGYSADYSGQGQGSWFEATFTDVCESNSGKLIGIWTEGGAEGDILYFDDVSVYKTPVGDATTNYTSLPAADFTALEHGKKYTWQMDANSEGIKGSELITNGDFSDYTGWAWVGGADTTYWDRTGGEFESLKDGAYSNNTIEQTILTADLWYELTFDLTLVGGEGGWYEGSAGQATAFYSNGTHTHVFQSAGTFLRPYATLTGVVFDNVSLKQVTPPDLELVVGDSSKTFSDVDPSAFETLVWNFEWDTTGNPTPDLQMYLNQPDTVYIDNMDVSQAYDFAVIGWFNPANVATTYRLFSYRSLSELAQWDFYYASGDLRAFINGTTYNPSSTNDPVLNQWDLFYLSIDRTDSMYFDLYPRTGNGWDITEIGTIRSSITPLQIGAFNNASEFNGLIGELQFIRFDNIEDAGFGDSDVLTNYNNGTKGKNMTGSYTGGTIVGWWKWKGNTNALFLGDETTNNDLTGVNATQADDQYKAKGGYK